MAGSTSDVRARVVIVEDEADVRDLVRFRLGLDDRFQVVGEAADSATALLVVSAERPDVVVLDLRLPGAIGSDLIPMILEAAPRAKVAVFSGLPAETMQAEAFSRGAASYVEKGDVERLIDALDALVGRVELAEDEFEQDLANVRLARRFAADNLTAWGLHTLIDAVTLIVSELSTNAVVHARSAFTLRLKLASSALRVEVVDCGPGLPNPINPDPTGVGGRGLLLVSELSVAWGIDAGAPPCKTVWCEVALDGSAA
jgi:DNA-binding NarL/FixJ family response regulator